VAVVGTLCLAWDGALGNNCTSFDLPNPELVTGKGGPSGAERRVLWGQSYCKELTLGTLNGKTPKLCVRNENPKDKAPTGCLRLSLRHIDPALIKELRVAIHPDCGGIPTENKDRFQKRRNRTKLAPGKEMNAIRICFGDVPATSTCCETEQCLEFEAVVEDIGFDTEIRIKDDTCVSDEGCSYSIGCPNLITEANTECGYVNCISEIWNGTTSNDLFIVPEDETRAAAYFALFEGYDVVIGSDGKETIGNTCYGGDGSTLFLKGGNDEAFMGAGEEKIYFGKGDDRALVFEPDGYQDLVYGGEGADVLIGEVSDEDILKSITPEVLPP